jgi:hypothetical protein
LNQRIHTYALRSDPSVVVDVVQNLDESSVLFRTLTWSAGGVTHGPYAALSHALRDMDRAWGLGSGRSSPWTYWKPVDGVRWGWKADPKYGAPAAAAAGGNRCGHNRRHWRRELVGRPRRQDPSATHASFDAGQPWVLAAAAAALARRLFLDRGSFPELRKAIQLEATSEGERSEILETIVLVMVALLVRTSLQSLRVGWPSRRMRGGKVHDFAGLPRSTIARWTGRSDAAICRALQILRHVGWVHGPGRDGFNVIKQPVEPCDPKHCRPTESGVHGLAAVRRISVLFFAELELQPQLEELQRAKAQDGQAQVVDIATARAAAAGPARSVVRLVGNLAAKRALERPPDSS